MMSEPHLACLRLIPLRHFYNWLISLCLTIIKKSKNVGKIYPIVMHVIAKMEIISEDL